MTSFTPPPRALRKAKLDNLALLPASLLPFKAEYQAIANQQAPGTTLIILPSSGGRQRATLENVVARLRAKGQTVATVPAHRLNLWHQ
jgi:hypothetical protein